MDSFVEFIHTDNFMFILLALVLILLVAFIITTIKLSKLGKNYKKFMKKLGDGKNIQEDLETFMYRVEKVEKNNYEIAEYCKNLDNELEGCIQKIGMVRYNAFKDTGSDLSFALAMLDSKNNGVVLNGIYSREMSNIYAKPVENGISNYTLSEEEKQAIEKAVNSDNIYRVN